MPRMLRLAPEAKGKTPMPSARASRRPVLGPDPASLPPVAVPGIRSSPRTPHWWSTWLVRGVAAMMAATFLFRVAVVTAKILIGIETVDSAGSILGYGSFIDDAASRVISAIQMPTPTAPAAPANPSGPTATEAAR